MRRRLLINDKLPFKPVSESVAADICLVNNDTLEKLIVSGDDYDLETFPSDLYTPIGVVVVPASHNDDGNARIISLTVMDYDAPDSGNSVMEHISNIKFGVTGNDISTLDNKIMYPYISDDFRNIPSLTQNLIGWNSLTNRSYLPSDNLNNYQNPFDKEVYYYNATYDSVGHPAIPSPYLEDGSKNPIY